MSTLDTNSLQAEMQKALNAIKQVGQDPSKGVALHHMNLFDGLSEKIYGEKIRALKEKELVTKKEATRRFHKEKSPKKLGIGL